MNDPCKRCPIRINCDWISGLCDLSAREVVMLRPEATYRYELDPRAKHLTRSQIANAAKRHKRRVWIRTEFQPDKSLRAKYDKRRKPDTPRRAWERKYRKERAEMTNECTTN